MRLAWVTCSELPEPDYDEAICVKALAEAGIETDVVPWDGPDTGHDVFLLRSCWDYHTRVDEFTTWLDDTAARAKISNPASLVRWNLHKRYLLEIESWGVPIVPTAIVPRGDDSLPFSGRIVIKPCVSAGSMQTQRFDGPTDDAREFLREITAEKDAMVQPYMASVDGHGERSIVWIGGKVTHCVRKSPRFEDNYEDVSDGLEPKPEEVQFAETVMARISGASYARIDIMHDEDGQTVLSELELIEPSLFLEQAPSSMPQFVDTVRSIMQ